jgi:hypothetical protein
MLLLFVFVLLACFGTAAGGAMLLMAAKSALHEIEAFLLFLMSALFFCTLCVMVSLDDIEKVLKKSSPPEPQES